MEGQDSCDLLRLPPELFEAIVDLIKEPFDKLCFEVTCGLSTTESFRATASKFLTTWRTSLMGPDLDKLEIISQHAALRRHVKVIHIEDDCWRIDPWTTAKMTPGLQIWPRDENGMIDLGKLGVKKLNAMLVHGLLQPEKIVIRDYVMFHHVLPDHPFADFLRGYGIPKQVNHERAPEYNRHQINSAIILHPSVHHKAPGNFRSQMVSTFMQEVTRDADLAMTEILARDLRREAPRPIPPKTSLLHTPGFQGCGRGLGRPIVEEMMVSLLPSRHGEGMRFALVTSARFHNPSPWLEDVLSTAPNLKTLTLHFTGFHANNTHPVLLAVPLPNPPKLTSLCICTARLPDGNWLLALLANSAWSLNHLNLSFLTVSEGHSWQNMLSSIGERCTVLRDFSVGDLKTDGMHDCLRFPCRWMDAVPAELSNRPPGVQNQELGGRDAMRTVRSVSFHGEQAARVLLELVLMSTVDTRDEVSGHIEA